VEETSSRSEPVNRGLTLHVPDSYRVVLRWYEGYITYSFHYNQAFTQMFERFMQAAADWYPIATEGKKSGPSKVLKVTCQFRNGYIRDFYIANDDVLFDCIIHLLVVGKSYFAFSSRESR